MFGRLAAGTVVDGRARPIMHFTDDSIRLRGRFDSSGWWSSAGPRSPSVQGVESALEGSGGRAGHRRNDDHQLQAGGAFLWGFSWWKQRSVALADHLGGLLAGAHQGVIIALHAQGKRHQIEPRLGEVAPGPAGL